MLLMISNDDFNRKVKIKNWMKIAIGWPVMVVMFWLSYSSIIDLLSVNNNLGVIQRVRMAGVFNNVAPFFGVFIFGFIVCVPFLTLHPLTVPILKLIFSNPIGRLIVCCFVIGVFFFGVWIDNQIRMKLIKYNYVECVSDRELSLRYSSKSYALTPEGCN